MKEIQLRALEDLFINLGENGSIKTGGVIVSAGLAQAITTMFSFVQSTKIVEDADLLKRGIILIGNIKGLDIYVDKNMSMEVLNVFDMGGVQLFKIEGLKLEDIV